MRNSRDRIKVLYQTGIIFLESISAVIKVVLFSAYSRRILFAKTNNVAKCLVLGGGPSASEHLVHIQDRRSEYELIAINFFCNADSFNLYKPEHYVVADDIVFAGNNFSKDHVKISNDFLMIMNRVDWKMKLYIPHHFSKSWLLRKIANPNVMIVKVNTTPLSNYSVLSKVLFDYNLAMPVVESVIIMALFISIKLDYSKVFVTGVEHNWIDNFHVNENNESYFELHHFDGHTSVRNIEGRVNTFFESQSRLFKSHDNIRQYAADRNLEIINCTKDSLIDSYKRLNSSSF